MTRHLITRGMKIVCCVILFMVLVNNWMQDFSILKSRKEKARKYTKEITEVINDQRNLIVEEMEDYRFPNGTYISAKSLKDLIPEVGGQPIRSIIMTTWRSGSTFLGQVLNSHPANFYHFEPLADYGIIQIREKPLASEVLKNLKALLNCNYTGLDKYYEWNDSRLGYDTLVSEVGQYKYKQKLQNESPAVGEDRKDFPYPEHVSRRDHYLKFEEVQLLEFAHNTRLWEECQRHARVCWTPEFLAPFCRLFPFQSMKVLRLRLNFVEELLDDPTLNIRVLLLVRDPRGTLHSRRHMQWCRDSPDCIEPARLCADLAADHRAAIHLSTKYPQRFRVVRYEDLSVKPYLEVHDLFQFFGLDFHPSVEQFLDTHTNLNASAAWSTYRWKQGLSHQEVQFIQQSCHTAMDNWGYILATNSSHQLEFNPFTFKNFPPLSST